MVIFVKANNFGLVQTMGGAFIRGSAFIRDNTVLLNDTILDLRVHHEKNT